jgi:hypothetical protein
MASSSIESPPLLRFALAVTTFRRLGPYYRPDIFAATPACVQLKFALCSGVFVGAVRMLE